MITDVLDMSKIERADGDLSQELDLSALIEEVHILLENQAENKGVRFLVDVQELEAPTVEGTGCASSRSSPICWATR